MCPSRVQYRMATFSCSFQKASCGSLAEPRTLSRVNLTTFIMCRAAKVEWTHESPSRETGKKAGEKEACI